MSKIQGNVINIVRLYIDRRIPVAKILIMKRIENYEKNGHPCSSDHSNIFNESLNTKNMLPIINRPIVTGGKPITEDIAIELRSTTFGSASLPPRKEWVHSPILMGPPGQSLAYGLMAPRNSTKSLLTGLQAHIIKWILFDSRVTVKDKQSDEPPESYLFLSKDQQEEALWRACSEVIWRCATNINGQNGGSKAVVAMPSEKVYVQNSLKFYQDGVTEKEHPYSFETRTTIYKYLKSDTGYSRRQPLKL